MDEKPIDKDVILGELDKLHDLDQDYNDGRILGSMCTEANSFAKEVYYKFIDTNLGDHGLFKGTKLIESKVIESIGELLSIEKPYGHIVTGGTEANIMAIRAARNYARKFKGIVDGEIIIPESAHFSFKKAAEMLNLKIVEVNLDDNYKIDVDSLKCLISDKTVAIVAIAGTTELGLIDPIEEISKIAYENNIYLHVDAAFGGFSIPFLREMGFDLPVFDFSLEGVCSITIDPHKMGMAPIPAGGILFRKEEYLDVMAIDSPYLTIKTQSTIVGTRSGAASAATYAVMKYLGKEGYSKLIKEAMDNTKFLKENLEKIGYDVICEPELNLIAFNHPNMCANEFAEKLEGLGWKVSVAKCPVAIRVVLMNHIKLNHLKELIEDLKEIF